MDTHPSGKEEIRTTSMPFTKVVVATIPPGQDLLKGIKTIVQKERITHGVILSAVGSLSKARFRDIKSFPSKYPISDKDRIFQNVEGPFEILGLSGNIALRTDGQVHVHCHITAAKAAKQGIIVLGGHLTEGCETYVMVEVFIGKLPGGKFIRTMHQERKQWEISMNGGQTMD